MTSTPFDQTPDSDRSRALNQRTLKNAIRATGVGLHSGEQVALALRPAPPDTGIVFTRTDLDRPMALKACVANVAETATTTTLSDGINTLTTVEHLLSALSGLGIDNAFVDVSAAELPIMDGSAAPFVFLLQSAGVEEQMAAKQFIRILKTVTCRDGDSVAELSPYNGFRVDCTLANDHPVFTRQRKFASVEFSTMTFVREISRARTFGVLADYERLQAMNLARGGSVHNAVVVDDSRILNAEGLRLDDEFVKHRILDVIGDMYLLGHSLIGAFTGYQPGHRTNRALLRQLLADKDAFEIVGFASEADAPSAFARPVLAA